MNEHLNEWILDEEGMLAQWIKRHKKLALRGAASQSKEEFPCFPICQMMLK